MQPPSQPLTVLQGGAGDDVYVVGDQSVSVVEAANGGADEIRTSLTNFSIAAYANIESLTYAGSSGFVGTGNAGNNTVTGGANNDTLRGGAGADVLVGGGGTDVASYADSATAMLLNFATGTFSGIAAGDSFNSIERYEGSNFADTFVADGTVNIFDGGAGFDLVSYEASTLGVSINLATNLNTGLATGDLYYNIEAIQGSSFNDIVYGNSSNNIFIGGAGADTFAASSGSDTISYQTSSLAVNVDLAVQAATGGDATGDYFTSVENTIGSLGDDILSGDTLANRLEGFLGNDTIFGGDGDDFIFGEWGAFVGYPTTGATFVQADLLHGGNGNDTIRAASDDLGTVAYGDAGNDQIEVTYGTAYGGDGDDALYAYANDPAISGATLSGGSGNDMLSAQGEGDELYCDDGADTLWLVATSFGDGGEGGDTYHVTSSLASYIIDTGLSGTDTIWLDNIASLADAEGRRIGNDLVITTKTDWLGGSADHGLVLGDWYAGYNSIEAIRLASGELFTPM